MFPKIVVPPKSSILIGFSIINHPFWGTPIFGNHLEKNAPHAQDTIRGKMRIYISWGIRIPGLEEKPKEYIFPNKVSSWWFQPHFNPFEKYAQVKFGSFPQGSGWTSKICEWPPPRFLLGMWHWMGNLFFDGGIFFQWPPPTVDPPKSPCFKGFWIGVGPMGGWGSYLVAKMVISN